MKLAITLPAHERGWSTEDLRRFDRLKAKLARSDLKPRQRQQAGDELEALLRSRAERSEQEYRDAAMAETLRLAEIRGETIERSKGTTNIVSRDSLYALKRKGLISPNQYYVGCDVRNLYDGRVGSVTGQIGIGGGRSAHDNHAFVGRKFQEAQATAAIQRLEARVRKLDKFREIGASGELGVLLLQGVCRDNRALSWFGTGTAIAFNAKVLGLALDEAA